MVKIIREKITYITQKVEMYLTKSVTIEWLPVLALYWRTLHYVKGVDPEHIQPHPYTHSPLAVRLAVERATSTMQFSLCSIQSVLINLHNKVVYLVRTG